MAISNEELINEVKKLRDDSERTAAQVMEAGEQIRHYGLNMANALRGSRSGEQASRLVELTGRSLCDTSVAIKSIVPVSENLLQEITR